MEAKRALHTRRWRVVVSLFFFILLFGIGYASVRSRPLEPAGITPEILSVDFDNPCGVTSAAIAARLAGADRIDLKTARRSIPFDAIGRTSIGELVDGLERLGLSACAVRLAWSDLDKLSGQGPMIFFIRGSHFVAGLVTPGGEAVLIDHDKAYLVGRAELRAIWSGHAVLVRRDAQSLAETIRRLRL